MNKKLDAVEQAAKFSNNEFFVRGFVAFHEKAEELGLYKDRELPRDFALLEIDFEDDDQENVQQFMDGRMKAEFELLAECVVGKPYKVVKNWLEDRGLVVRRTQIDGVGQMATMDYLPERFNVQVEGASITAFDGFG